MSESPLRLIKRCTEYRPMSDLWHVPKGVRGIYVLYCQDRDHKDTYNVVYVGMSRGRSFSRLRSHGKSEKKNGLAVQKKYGKLLKVRVDNFKEGRSPACALRGLGLSFTCRWRLAYIYIWKARRGAREKHRITVLYASARPGYLGTRRPSVTE